MKITLQGEDIVLRITVLAIGSFCLHVGQNSLCSQRIFRVLSLEIHNTVIHPGVQYHRSIHVWEIPVMSSGTNFIVSSLHVTQSYRVNCYHLKFIITPSDECVKKMLSHFPTPMRGWGM